VVGGAGLQAPRDPSKWFRIYAGESKQRPSHEYMYARLAPTAKVDHVALDLPGAEILREVARRILADETGKITIGTEAVRLTS
jgi:site-specific DNA recombinase